jgi:hypothetical protein
MTAFETSATVQEQGQILVAGVPFAPGTEVEVTIKAVEHPVGTAAEAERIRQRFAALDKARNTESVGPLRREELYDRQVLR